ncbi:PhzF family phenazine biosynthesis protein [Pectobacterium punjabense]|uniref:PhzF family phenazine biosynthesis protein n=1 Tax=Pectobacterium punjabense TaxID=2108399 RepID=UPI001968B814|nr:PhzF family phenazine biosynthesis protein [Pectobacterium punjabense]MBN3138055.1 PhzF family phenazine biosynthesis protein [Pectobacterium punjabense]MCE5381452.1 PhzF family phenazine biosynthesis protein [Pectobacterium punjabense]
MPTVRRFKQVDVFTQQPFKGNPLAVIMEANGLTDAQMQDIARWTNLSETTFVLPATDPLADYHVRIFTPEAEMPFAGHPTLGTAHALLEEGLRPKSPGQLVQQCGVGLVPINIGDDKSLAFHAPQATIVPFDDEHTPLLEKALGITGFDSVTIDNRYPPTAVHMGIRWLVVRVDSADACLNIIPDADALSAVQNLSQTNGIAIYGPHDNATPADYEVRTFYIECGHLKEDPVTGSANACLAALLRQQHSTNNVTAPLSYLARQGTMLHCDGRITVTYLNDEPWIGGHSVTIVDGTLQY